MAENLPKNPEKIPKVQPVSNDINFPAKQKSKKTNLTFEERAFINSHWDDSDWSDERIANHLGRYKPTIAKYRKRNNLVKGPYGHLLAKPVDRPDSLEQNEHVLLLRKSPRYVSLRRNLMGTDLVYFEGLWAQFCDQFKDMTASEQDTLEVLIGLKLRMMNNEDALKQCKEYEHELKSQIALLDNDLDVEVEEQRKLREMSLSNNKVQMELNKEYREMLASYEKLFRALNGTREQREQNATIGGDTFLTLVQSFNERDRRNKVGKYNELMRIARKRKMEELKSPHEFIDGTVEPIIMDGADYVDLYGDKKPDEQ